MVLRADPEPPLLLAGSGTWQQQTVARASKLDEHEWELPGRGFLRFAVISDTHSNAHPAAAQQVGEYEPDVILHAGDIGDLQVLEPFREIAPLAVVRGNIDAPGSSPDVVVGQLSGANYRLRLVMTHIALYGPKLRKDARLLVQRHESDLLVCGHSHVPFLGKEGKAYVFNPGSIGPRRFALPIVWGKMEFGPGHSVVQHIDCETGKRWLPT